MNLTPFKIVLFLLSTPLYGESFRVKDIFKNIDAKTDGLKLSASALNELHGYSEHVSLTPGAYKVYEFGSEIIESVSFDDFFKSKLTTNRTDDWRGLSLIGLAKKPKFVIDAIKGPSNENDIKQFAEFATDLDMRIEEKPIQDEKRGYGIRSLTYANSGPLNHRHVQAFAGNTFKFLAAENVAMIAQGKKTLDEGILHELNTSLPKSMKMVTKYLDFKPGITIKGTDVKYTEVKTKIYLDFTALSEDYEELGEFLENLFDSFDFDAKIYLKDQLDQTLWQASMVSSNRTVELSFVTKDGKLIPQANDGRPLFDQALDLASIREHSGTVVTEVFGDVLGLKFNAKGMTLSHEYKDGEIAKFETRLTKIPPPVISGRALGIFPSWMIDAAIPGSIDEYARKFTAGILHGSKGKGTFATGRFNTKNPESNAVSIHGTTLFIDNFFVNFGLSVVQSYIWPTPEVISDAHALGTKILGFFAADVSALGTNNGQ